MHIFGKNGAISLIISKSGMKHQTHNFCMVCFNDYPGLTYFTTNTNVVSNYAYILGGGTVKKSFFMEKI